MHNAKAIIIGTRSSMCGMLNLRTTPKAGSVMDMFVFTTIIGKARSCMRMSFFTTVIAAFHMGMKTIRITCVRMAVVLIKGARNYKRCCLAACEIASIRIPNSIEIDPIIVIKKPTTSSNDTIA